MSTSEYQIDPSIYKCAYQSIILTLVFMNVQLCTSQYNSSNRNNNNNNSKLQIIYLPLLIFLTPRVTFLNVGLSSGTSSQQLTISLFQSSLTSDFFGTRGLNGGVAATAIFARISTQ